MLWLLIRIASACYGNDPKFLDRQALAYSADPDQTATRGAVLSDSTQ